MFGYDEHYAQHVFLEQIFLKVLGPAGITRLVPQVPFKDHDGVQRSTVDRTLDLRM